jgi:hypothetical protein
MSLLENLRPCKHDYIITIYSSSATSKIYIMWTIHTFAYECSHRDYMVLLSQKVATFITTAMRTSNPNVILEVVQMRMHTMSENNNNNNSIQFNSIQFFIIYVPSQQPQGQLQTQHSNRYT